MSASAIIMGVIKDRDYILAIAVTQHLAQCLDCSSSREVGKIGSSLIAYISGWQLR